MAIVGIEFENSANGLDGPGGVQGREHQVTGLGSFHAGLHGFAVTNLTQENDVRGFTQNVLEALAIGVDVAADFLLGHKTG
jgi:hypothetical protein